ncbi:MAG: linear amide C-N hydrolase, partial [Clostridia bacterium]|nr:linear amide C-N hydrolase [Clostridia bacterium]
MCTAITYSGYNTYFGRNLDLEHLYDEAVTVVPRKFPLRFKREETLENHYAIIGMSTIINNYPLFYDATNEHGLSMAGLNFVGNAVYHDYEYEGVEFVGIEHYFFLEAHRIDFSSETVAQNRRNDALTQIFRNISG